MTAKRTIGIDLGTTNSVVATIDERGKPLILRNRLGDSTTPSCVAFDGESGDVVVGAPARRLAVTHPRAVVYAAKRLIGKRYDDPDVQALARTLPYRVAPAPNGDAHILVGGRLLAPEMISAYVLAELRAVAEAHFGDAVDEAIITVPAYFDNQQRRATLDAAAIAGLRVRRLVNEPTAAALGYGAHRGANRRFAVCDLGGGTFDVSIVNVEDGVFEVISTHGDAFLGGEDFDRAIVENLAHDVARERGLDVAAEPQALQRLREAAEAVKHELSAAREARIDLRHLGVDAGGKPVHVQRTVTRDELERWTEPILRRLEPPCRECIARCGLTPADIDAVILVGGMTRMPAVQARLAAIFGRQPLKVVNPDEIVSIGAATQLAILDGRIEDVVLLDVTSRALGIDAGARYQVVIPRNATIPTREHKIIATTRDDQDEIVIDVYEGESRNVEDNRHLSRYLCTGLTRAPAGEVLVAVDFTINVDGILRLSVSELGSGRRPELRLTATTGLTRAEVQRLARDLRVDG